MRNIWEHAGYDSAVVRGVFSHEGTFGETPASVCLQLWISSVEGTEAVWWREAYIPVGWQISELGRGETSCWASSTRGECVSALIPHCHSGYFVYPPGNQDTQGNPNHRSEEVRGQGQPPEAGIEFKFRLEGHEHIYSHKYSSHRQHLGF